MLRYFLFALKVRSSLKGSSFIVTSLVVNADCMEWLAAREPNSIDAIVTDPPYGIGYMGAAWDDLPPGKDWAELCLAALKPGAHLLAFGATRTWHRLAAAIEDAGFEMRDSIAWLHSQGFPKGSNLKPAFEPIVVARKPFTGSSEANQARWGTGELDIENNRIATTDRFGGGAKGSSGFVAGYSGEGWTPGNESGRWPANVILDESEAESLDLLTDNASRYFFVAKANKFERPEVNGVKHKTVKPVALMRHLVRLATPPGGLVVDTFAGSGATVEAAILEGYDVIGIEREAEYIPLIEFRVKRAQGLPSDDSVGESTDANQSPRNGDDGVWNIFAD